jgi:hypothetical protein
MKNTTATRDLPKVCRSGSRPQISLVHHIRGSFLRWCYMYPRLASNSQPASTSKMLGLQTYMTRPRLLFEKVCPHWIYLIWDTELFECSVACVNFLSFGGVGAVSFCIVFFVVLGQEPRASHVPSTLTFIPGPFPFSLSLSQLC